MASNLEIYLNDHHAGSVAALELLDQLIEKYNEVIWREFFAALHIEIKADQQILEELIRIQAEEVGIFRQAAAWATEKVARAKIRLSNPGKVDFGLFLALEVLVLGITGKYHLWSVLNDASKTNLLIRRFAFSELKISAANQRDKVEGKRLEVGRIIFNP